MNTKTEHPEGRLHKGATFYFFQLRVKKKHIFICGLNQPGISRLSLVHFKVADNLIYCVGTAAKTEGNRLL
jgi:hypothetical protein